MHSEALIGHLAGNAVSLGTYNMQLCREIFQGSESRLSIGDLPSPTV